MCIVVCFFDLNDRMIRIHSSFLVAYPPNLQHIFHGTERLSERMNPNGEHCARNCDWGPFYIHLCIPLWLNPLQFHSNHSNLIQTHLNRKFCYLRVPLSPLSIHNGIISIMPVKIPAKHLPSSLPPKISSGLNLAIWQGSQIAEWIMADSVRSRIRCQTTCEDTAFSTVDHRQKSDGQIFRWTSKHLSAICKDVSLTYVKKCWWWSRISRIPPWEDSASRWAGCPTADNLCLQVTRPGTATNSDTWVLRRRPATGSVFPSLPSSHGKRGVFLQGIKVITPYTPR